MASNIDATKPTEGNATTQSVRDNFAAAKAEIEALQAQVAANEWGAWIEPQLINGWQTASGIYQVARYRKKGNGDMQIQGNLIQGQIGMPAFILPEGYRPPKTIAVAQISNGALGQTIVTYTGEVIPWLGSNVSFWLDDLFSTT